MSTTITTKANVTRIMDATQPTTVINPTATTSIDDYERTAAVSFASIPSANIYNKVESVNFVVRTSGAAYLEVSGLREPFDPSTVCYEEYPSPSGTRTRGYTDGTTWLTMGLTVMDTLGDYSPGIQAIKNGLLLQAYQNSLTFYTAQAASASRPYLQITFGDDVHLTPTGYPTQGYVDRQQDLTLQWSNEVSGVSVETPYQQTAELHWRMAGGSDHVISLTDEESYTIPANTMGSGTMIWSIEVKDSTGAITSSGEYRLTTVEPLSTAVALQPKNTSIDAANGIDFTWRHYIATGTVQTAADIQISDDGTTWTDLANPTGAAQTYHAAPGAVASGTHYWRVRTYNQDNAAGSWSASVTFASIAPPLAPSVMATAESRPTVTWTAAEQQAYEIQIDSRNFGPFFGQETGWRATVYLQDGSHNAKVRVQNAYGLWSAWGTWTFTVANETDVTVTLTAESGDSPVLSWATTGTPAPDRWLVYRDGELIANTTAQSYQDTTAAAGSHEYQVRGIYDDDGTYTLSDTESASTIVAGALITDAQTGAVIECPTVLEIDRVIRQAQSINVSFIHYAGAVWPTAEATVERDNSYNISPTWVSGQEPDLLSLLGREVLVRDQYGGRVFGVLVRLTPEYRQTRIRITLQIQQTGEPEVTL